MDDGEISQHAAYPAVVDVKHIAAPGFFFYNALCLFLGADEQDLAAVGYRFFYEFTGFIQHTGRLLQVYDMDTVALGEDISLHTGMPAAGLVTEVRPRFKKLLYINCFGQVVPLSNAG